MFKKDVYRNRYPELLEIELANARVVKMVPMQVGENGFDQAIRDRKIKWAVDTNGILKVVPEFVGGTELKHSVIFNGDPVIAAGEAEILGSKGHYQLLFINNDSGHYRPALSSLKIGIEAFKRAGVKIPENIK